MKIGLLNAYHFDGNPVGYQSRYRVIFEAYFRRVCPPTWSFDVYEVAQNQFPESCTERDAWIIGGSGKSCYEEDEWIRRLADWVRQCDSAKVALLGICFGHQMIAHALGGKVVRSDRGWGIGVRTFQFSRSPSWYSPLTAPENAWMQRCDLIFSHQDQVVSLPPQAECYASDAFCPIQAFGVGRHIFTLQGHPEVTAVYARERLLSREASIGKAVCEKALASLEKPVHDDEIGDLLTCFLRHAEI